jgi:hypothetical protein
MSGDAHGRSPFQPGYVPRVDPTDQRDVGQGRELGADLYALYRAGRAEIPDIAALYSEMTSSVHDVTQRLSFLGSSVGNPDAFAVIGELRDQLHVALRRTTVAMRDTATALVRIADDYARTDQAARDEFARLLRDNAASFDSPSTPVPVPPMRDSPYATPYAAPSLEPLEPPPSWLESQLNGLADRALDGLRDGADRLLGAARGGEGR